ncbi:MAG TPA: T9SS type A sorting domain-containing protein [Candidatus Babeliaceae bacterium]|nr:T9SS type A sorting domain-containing protein [Candidatus Babeliaceae bacterium]
MKRIILLLTTIGALLLNKTYAQPPYPFSVNDTVYLTAPAGVTAIVHDDVISAHGVNPHIKWSVVNTNFPTDWLFCTSICDNKYCYIGELLYPPKIAHLMDVSASKTLPFFLSMALNNASTEGNYFLTVQLTDIAEPYSTTETFIVSKGDEGKSVNNEGIASHLNTNDIKIYPNPADNNITVSYPENSGIEKILLFDVTGKLISTNKAQGNNATINLEDLASGVYFIRLLDPNGNTVVNKKFTHL